MIIPLNIISSHKFSYSILPKTNRAILKAAVSHASFSRPIFFLRTFPLKNFRLLKKKTNYKYVINISIYLSLLFYRYSKLNLYRNLREVCISISRSPRPCLLVYNYTEHATREEEKEKKKRKDKKTWPLVSHANNAN